MKNSLSNYYIKLFVTFSLLADFLTNYIYSLAYFLTNHNILHEILQKIPPFNESLQIGTRIIIKQSYQFAMIPSLMEDTRDISI